MPRNRRLNRTPAGSAAEYLPRLLAVLRAFRPTPLGRYRVVINGNSVPLIAYSIASALYESARSAGCTVALTSDTEVIRLSSREGTRIQ